VCICVCVCILKINNKRVLNSIINDGNSNVNNKKICCIIVVINTAILDQQVKMYNIIVYAAISAISYTIA
jgi:hypothetical protein